MLLSVADVHAVFGSLFHIIHMGSEEPKIHLFQMYANK